ncbi:MAG: 1-acyl-sn-glycerol-3-phosphate acyltransferase, partial [Acidobacteriota bacterium]
PTGRPVASHNGFAFDYASLLACAWGKPSKAFGDMYRVFDGPRQVARLPGPPYHFMSRIARIDGAMGRFEPGAVLEAEYDVPPEAWYFAENGQPTMPFAVLMEAGLQPCGWLASYIGSALTTDIDLQFRNLDGTGTLTAEVNPTSGTLTSHVKLVATSSSAGVLIVRFEVEMRDDQRRPIFTMQTAFGFFPAEAMQNQVGLPASDEARGWLERDSDFAVDLTARPERYCSGSLALAGPKLLMLDRITGYWPDAGEAGLGRLRAEKTVDPGEWFFKAHFFQDPVQPGSLGIEAMVQLLQFYMLHTDMRSDIERPRFESLGVDHALTWKYRGQVLPTNGLIQTELEIVEVGRDDRGPYALAQAFLWVDGKRIYSATNLGMRIISGAEAPRTEVSGYPGPSLRDEEEPSAGSELQAEIAPEPEIEEPASGAALPTPPGVDEESLGFQPVETEPSGDLQAEEILDPERDTWVNDHCPTWTLPALPMMSLVDRLAAAAQARCSELRVVGLEDVRVVRWVAFPNGPLRLKTEIDSVERRGSEKAAVELRLMVWRDAANPLLSRFEVAATGRVLMARDFCSPPQAVESLADALPVADPYAAGNLFHGPAFHLLRQLAEGAAGSTAQLDAGGGSVPHGTLHPALLDAATHGIPHDALQRWCAEIPSDVVAYPQRLSEARFYGRPPTTGAVRCEARFESYDAETREAVFHLQLLLGEKPWADMRLREVLLPKGPIGSAPANHRRAFLRDQVAVPGLALARFEGEHTLLSEAEVIASDWLPGTIARAYGVSAAAGNRAAVAREVAIKDHVARRAEVHPATITTVSDPTDPLHAAGFAARFPLTRFPVSLLRGGEGELRVTDAGLPGTDVTPLRRYWDEYLGLTDWPVEDIYYGLIERFVRRVVVTDPQGLAAIYGRSTLFLANHQVGIESLLFSIVASALVGTPTVTLAKAEHRTSWLGTLIAQCFSYPGVDDPEVIAFFERENMRSLPLIIRKLGKRMANEPRSVAVHCEGTRSLTCRQPVAKLSGSFVDMAMKAGAAIVPVRFIGGLPAEPLAQRIAFPLGQGQQDYLLGSPLLPEDLEPLRYKDRRGAVMDAINALGPSNDTEEPLPPNPEFAAEVEAWIAETGATHQNATIWKTLAHLADPGDAVRRLITAAEGGRLEVDDDPTGRWLAEIARRFFDERGPEVVIRPS